MIRSTVAAFALAPALALSGCGDTTASESAGADSSAVAQLASVPYDLANPDEVFRLEPDLLEISGLAMRDNGQLLAIYDEAGVLFTVDSASGVSVDRRRFGSAGDYEGVEWVDGVTWVLRSDGTLFRIPDDGSTTTEIDTPLRSRCDAEGLGYDRIGRVLLVVCKEDPGEGFGGARSIYSFDLRTNTLSATPVLLVERRMVDAREQFKPSAVAVHPETRRVYVVSSVRKLLVVLTPAGNLESMAALDPELLPQPEGLVFAPDGTLFISSEGVNGPATILRFAPRR
jgi:uncharacterized protein YjiK